MATVSWGLPRHGCAASAEEGCAVVPRLLCGLPRQIRQLSCGESHSLALSEGGEVFSWGSALMGALGHPELRDESLPRRLELLGGPSVQIGAAKHHSAVLSSEGIVWTFGWDGSASSRCQRVPVPLAHTRAGGARALAVGDGHIAALTRSDGIVCVGGGALFAGLLDGEVVTALAAGSRHTAALTSQGSVFTWTHSRPGSSLDSQPSLPPLQPVLRPWFEGSEVITCVGDFTAAAQRVNDASIIRWERPSSDVAKPAIRGEHACPCQVIGLSGGGGYLFAMLATGHALCVPGGTEASAGGFGSMPQGVAPQLAQPGIILRLGMRAEDEGARLACIAVSTFHAMAHFSGLSTSPDAVPPRRTEAEHTDKVEMRFAEERQIDSQSPLTGGPSVTDNVVAAVRGVKLPESTVPTAFLDADSHSIPSSIATMKEVATRVTTEEMHGGPSGSYSFMHEQAHAPLTVQPNAAHGGIGKATSSTEMRHQQCVARPCDTQREQPSFKQGCEGCSCFPDETMSQWQDRHHGHALEVASKVPARGACDVKARTALETPSPLVTILQAPPPQLSASTVSIPHSPQSVDHDDPHSQLHDDLKDGLLSQLRAEMRDSMREEMRASFQDHLVDEIRRTFAEAIQLRMAEVEGAIISALSTPPTTVRPPQAAESGQSADLSNISPAQPSLMLASDCVHSPSPPLDEPARRIHPRMAATSLSWSSMPPSSLHDHSCLGTFTHTRYDSCQEMHGLSQTTLTSSQQSQMHWPSSMDFFPEQDDQHGPKGVSESFASIRRCSDYSQGSLGCVDDPMIDHPALNTFQTTTKSPTRARSEVRTPYQGDHRHVDDDVAASPRSFDRHGGQGSSSRHEPHDELATADELTADFLELERRAQVTAAYEPPKTMVHCTGTEFVGVAWRAMPTQKTFIEPPSSGEPLLTPPDSTSERTRHPEPQAQVSSAISVGNQGGIVEGSKPHPPRQSRPVPLRPAWVDVRPTHTTPTDKWRRPGARRRGAPGVLPSGSVGTETENCHRSGAALKSCCVKSAPCCPATALTNGARRKLRINDSLGSSSNSAPRSRNQQREARSPQSMCTCTPTNAQSRTLSHCEGSILQSSQPELVVVQNSENTHRSHAASSRPAQRQRSQLVPSVSSEIVPRASPFSTCSAPQNLTFNTARLEKASNRTFACSGGVQHAGAPAPSDRPTSKDWFERVGH